jgi:hypothetical protein
MSFAVSAADELVGFVIAGDLLGLRVEVQRPLDAAGDIGEVHELGGKVPLFDVGVRPAAGADAVEEVLMMRRQIDAARARFAWLVLQTNTLKPLEWPMMSWPLVP